MVDSDRSKAVSGSSISDDLVNTSMYPVMKSRRGWLVLNWNAVWVVLGLLGLGGGSVGFFGLVRHDEVEEIVDKRIDKKVDTYANPLIEKHAEVHEKLNGKIGGLNASIGNLEKAQNWNIADNAAERVCAEVPKYKRDKCEKKLFQWNMQRLEAAPKKMPCRTVTCSE